MISSIDELVAFTQRRAASVPHRIGITRPGSSIEAVARVAKQLPGIPTSYLSVIRELALDRVAIGYFWLSPEGFPGRDLTERVIACNDPSQNPLEGLFRRQRVYQVASWEADPIAVVHAEGLFKVGQTVLYNSGNFEDTPEVIGNAFEDFLLLVGNLYAIRDKYGKTGGSQAMMEFEACLSHLVHQHQESIARTWKRVAEEVLS